MELSLFTLVIDEKLTFGNDSDLKISHNGQHSLIQDAGTGQLRIAGSIVNIRNAANDANMVRAVEGGAVTFFYNGNEKLITTDSGVNITGDIRLGNVDFTNNGIIDSARLPLGTFAVGGGGGGASLDDVVALAIALG